MDIMSMNWCMLYGRNMFRQDSEIMQESVASISESDRTLSSYV